MSDAPYSKGAVNRAGQHLAQRLGEVLAGQRPTLIDEHDEDDVRARDIVHWWQDQHVPPMLAVDDVVRGVAPSLRLEGWAVQVVTFRPKRFETIVDKLRRETVRLGDMVDLGGVRAVVNTQEEVDALARDLGEQLDVRRTRDWTRQPRATGYRAVHLHVRHGGRMIEIQLRTFGQDAWANAVEAESRLSGHNYKAGQGPKEVLDFLRAFAEANAAFELTREHPEPIPRSAAVMALLKTPKLKARYET